MRCPLADSTFVLAANLNNYLPTSQSRQVTYLAHLKVPGLRRVVDSHYVPAANDPLVTAVPRRAGDLPLSGAYPSPAGETVAFNCQPPSGGGPARLVVRDLTGRTVLTHSVPATGGELSLSVHGLSGGLYLCSFEVAGRVLATRKLAIAR
ncbi:MAG: hypothetical protein EOO59_03140 [Hymenobacter sp.]|nr:MAG: hypothetical protein EOO59_03140 [Hymenobacter sp.]